MHIHYNVATLAFIFSYFMLKSTVAILKFYRFSKILSFIHIHTYTFIHTINNMYLHILTYNESTHSVVYHKHWWEIKPKRQNVINLKVYYIFSSLDIYSQFAHNNSTVGT